MLNTMTKAAAATLLWAYALPAGAVPAAAIASSPPIAQAGMELVQLAQASERREVRRERRDLREERRELRRAQRTGDRSGIREERRDVRRARRDLRDARRDLRDDRRYYVRDGRRFYRGSNGAEIFAGLVAGALAAGAAAAAQPSDAVAYCESRFRSYNRASGTYLGYDGRRHACP